MKIKDIRHLLTSEMFELEETLTSSTGEHKIYMQVTEENLFRYDDLEVVDIKIGSINTYSAIRMLRLVIK